MLSGSCISTYGKHRVAAWCLILVMRVRGESEEEFSRWRHPDPSSRTSLVYQARSQSA